MRIVLFLVVALLVAAGVGAQTKPDRNGFAPALTDSITANVRQSGEALPTLFAGLISADCHNNVSDCAAVLRAFAHTEEYDLVVARAAWIQGAQSDAICVGAFHTWQCREVEN